MDDWSGAALLPSLYQSLKLTEHRKHTYEFVAFTAEERGLVGSTRYVKELGPERRGTVKAFVNLECLGLTTPKVWVSRSTPNLVRLLGEIADATKTPIQGVNVDKVGDELRRHWESRTASAITSAPFILMTTTLLTGSWPFILNISTLN